MKRHQASAQVQSVMQLLALEPRAHQLFGQLSKGFRQRVGLADALLGDSRCLLLDEPFGGLDPLQRQEFRKLLRRLAGQGKAILFSSHVLPEVEEMADRLLVINSGKMIASGSCEELLGKVHSSSALLIEVAADDISSLQQALLKEYENINVSVIGEQRIKVNAETTIDRRQFFSWLAQRPEQVIGVWQQDANLESLFRNLIGNSSQGVEQ